ncbi:TetR/AcrR family transcriptional regulator [Subtercola lobariae]|uniref:TetR family transcriptional regulator n=1 Tax=Subtercola lobariae TaxID=1588641 RepID=A0A917EXL2_9MICO|nr:TetR/AcrR family transcriptional regulator [Subtercola lobariae]GGF31500.1 TetR family transcriptional regulator [Subtercola lobariae]
MARTDARSGPQTRARISQIATRLFLERGFDSVTVADVAQAAGVSSVTVFNHFPRKEDLLLDRAVDAVDLLRSTIREREAGVDALAALHAEALRLAAERHALAAIGAETIPFFRTVAASPALVARAREIAAELQRILTDELERDPNFTGDATLLAAFFIAGYSTVMVQNARRLIAGEEPGAVAGDHNARLENLFAALRSGLPSA